MDRRVIYVIYRMICDTEFNLGLLDLDPEMVICDLRNKELQDTKAKTDFCCDSPEIITDNGM